MSENIKIKSTTELTNIQKLVAGKMIKATTVPQLYQNVKVDTMRLLDTKEKLQKKIFSAEKVKITYTDFLIKITSTALREHLEINSTYADGKYIIYDDINIGMAISIDNDLFVATLYEVDKLEINGIAKKRIELVDKAKKQKLSLPDVKYSTFTLTNIGMYGIRSSYAIINTPQAAILAIGEIYSEPAIIDEKIVPRSFIELSLSVDHRIVNGVLSAKFLHRIAYLIENPDIIFNT